LTTTPTPSATSPAPPLFLAASNGLANARSTNGASWTGGNFSNSRSWSDISYSNSTYVAVAYNSANYDTSSDGISWSDNSYNISHPNNLFTKTLYGNNKYLVFANSSTGFYSNDATSWNSFIVPNANWSIAAYGNGIYVAVVPNSSTFVTSTDGVTWTQRTLPVSRNWTDMIYGGNQFILVATTTTTTLYSSDGINWNTATLPTSKGWKSVAYGNGIYVILANNSSTTVYSNDGINWNTGMGLGSTVTDMAFGNNNFVAVENGTIVATSTDGITWTQRSISNNNWGAIVFNS
jgi:hypothetical protein